LLSEDAEPKIVKNIGERGSEKEFTNRGEVKEGAWHMAYLSTKIKGENTVKGLGGEINQDCRKNCCLRASLSLSTKIERGNNRRWPTLKDRKQSPSLKKVGNGKQEQCATI